MTIKRLVSVLSAAALCFALFAGCAKEDGTVAATVNGKELTLGYLNETYNLQVASYNVSYSQDDGTNAYDSMKYMEISEGMSFDQYLRDNLFTTCVYTLVVENLFDDYGLSIGSEDKTALDDQFEAYKANFSTDAEFKAWLDSYSINEQKLKDDLLYSMKIDKINDYLFGENGVEKLDETAYRETLANDYVRVKHILVKYVDSSNNPLEGEELAAQQAKYAEVKAKVDAGEDFETLMAEYNEDVGSNTEDNNEGYIFTSEDSYDENFKETSFALEVGEVGECESVYGMHLIKKYPTDDDVTFEKKGAGLMESDQSVRLDEIVTALYESYQEQGLIVRNDDVVDAWINANPLPAAEGETEDQTGEGQTGEDQTGEDQTGEDQTGEDQTGEDQTGAAD